jgi:O-antigen/teichoic acid export membrane protein
VAVHAIVGLIQIAYKFIVIKKSLPLKINWRNGDRSIYKEIFSFSIWVTITTLASRLIFNITPSILGVVANSAAIAVFGIVTTLEGYSYTITSAINGVFMPKISRIYEEGDAEKNIMPLFLGVGKFQYALNGLIVVGFTVIGKQFIELWMGPSYIDAYIGIVLVMIPGMFYNALQIANTAMVVQKRVNVQAFVNLATGLCNIMLSFFLSARFGVVGACISICIAYFVRAGAMHVIHHKLMRFDMIAFIKGCYLRLSIPILLTTGLGLLANRYLPDGGWIMLIVKGAAVTLLYLLLVAVFGLNKTEKHQIFEMIKRKRK